MSKTLQLFLSSDAVQVSQQADDKARTFEGVANSGKPFNYYGQRAIVDLSTLEFHNKVPVLLQHDRDSRVGFGTLKVENHQLLITGTLLENEQAQKIAKDADDGFPFQMSAHVKANSTEELKGNQTAEVNGQTVTAPILILRHCFIPEVSFTPTGVDNQTSAMILSDDGSFQPSTHQGENMNEIEQLKAQISKMQEQIDTLEKENANLKTEKAQAEAEAKKSTVEAELSNNGFSKNEKGEWQGISSTTVDLLLSTDVEKAKTMIADLAKSQANKPSIPDFLLSEQHTAGQTQSTGNPLLDNAVARNKAQQSYL